LGKNFDKKLIIKNFNEDETEEYAWSKHDILQQMNLENIQV
jgi:hypothetical protein